MEVRVQIDHEPFPVPLNMAVVAAVVAVVVVVVVDGEKGVDQRNS